MTWDGFVQKMGVPNGYYLNLITEGYIKQLVLFRKDSRIAVLCHDFNPDKVNDGMLLEARAIMQVVLGRLQ
jgi:hypothetical protein